MNIDFWFDPACPWCWLTSRWVLDVAPHRNLVVRWRPISLKVKNDVQPDSPFYERVMHTHALLRVVESVRAAEGDGAIEALYTEMGEQIHHHGNSLVPAEQVLAAVGLPTSHAAAAIDPSWDAAIDASMADGLGLTGKDVGTPIIGFGRDDGSQVGFFGPVISRRLPHEQALKLWDGLVLCTSADAFWELKRTRTEAPDFTLPAE